MLGLGHFHCYVWDKNRGHKQWLELTLMNHAKKQNDPDKKQNDPQRFESGAVDQCNRNNQDYFSP